MENENEKYLADWLAGTISDDQLRQLVSKEDVAAFQKIRKAFDKMSVPEPDLEKNFAAIKHKMDSKAKSPRKKSVIPMWVYAAAACMILSLGWYQVYVLSNEVSTDFGNQKNILLADNSKVTLNAKSKVCYSNLFQYNRTIKLDGEAFFEVEKGRSFIVTTALGEVKVLGTKFNVISFSDYFEVVCYEGKVQVQANHKKTILTPGESVRFYNGIYENWATINPKKPLWISGETDLKKVPMKYVFDKFERQFNVKVDFPKNIENIKFTGSFTNSDIKKALQSICIPLHLSYTTTTSGTIQISK